MLTFLTKDSHWLRRWRNQGHLKRGRSKRNWRRLSWGNEGWLRRQGSLRRRGGGSAHAYYGASACTQKELRYWERSGLHVQTSRCSLHRCEKLVWWNWERCAVHSCGLNSARLHNGYNCLVQERVWGRRLWSFWGCSALENWAMMLNTTGLKYPVWGSNACRGQ